MFSIAVSVGTRLYDWNTNDPVAPDQRQFLVAQRGEFPVADENLPGRRVIERGQAVQQRRFPGTGRPHDRCELTVTEFRTHPVEGGQRCIAGPIHLSEIDRPGGRSPGSIVKNSGNNTGAHHVAPGSEGIQHVLTRHMAHHRHITLITAWSLR
jgi:hypothetical protein